LQSNISNLLRYFICSNLRQGLHYRISFDRQMLRHLRRTTVSYPKCSLFASLGPGHSFDPVHVLPSSIMAPSQSIAPKIHPPSPGPPMSTCPPTGCGPGGEWSAIPVKLGPDRADSQPPGLRNRTTEAQSALRTTNGDDYYPGRTWLGFSG
jgi:hypothetical protein